MSLNRPLLFVASGFLFFAAGFSFAGKAPDVLAAARPADAKVEADQEVLKINAECNDAELRGDVAAMDNCETADFTHTHANGMVEHKAEYLKGVGSGAHKFLALDLSGVQVRSYGDTAIVEEHLHLRAGNRGRNSAANNRAMNA